MTERTIDHLRIPPGDAAEVLQALLCLSSTREDEPNVTGVLLRHALRLARRALAADPIAVITVKSTAVAAVGYSVPLRVLLVRFAGGDGRTYLFADVPPDVFDGVRTAASVGKYVNGSIKGKFLGMRVEPDDVAPFVREAGNG